MLKVIHANSMEQVIPMLEQDMQEENYEPEYYLATSLLSSLSSAGFRIESHGAINRKSGKIRAKLYLLEPVRGSDAEMLLLKFRDNST